MRGYCIFNLGWYDLGTQQETAHVKTTDYSC